jgi:excisionase family DNA binding protein
MSVGTLDARVDNLERTLAANKKVLTFEEGCIYTGFAKSYMYKLTSAGKIPFSKPNGKTIFFDREKLDAWLLSNSTTSEEEKEAKAATYISNHS